MASASDVRSILSLPAVSSPAAGPSQPKNQVAVSNRKPEGISRELYSLIGPSAPTLLAQLAQPRLKQKPNLGGGGKVKWYTWSILYLGPRRQLKCTSREWRLFKNGARSDSLKLGHWVKATDNPDAGSTSSYWYCDVFSKQNRL